MLGTVMGVGTDIVKVERIRKAVERHGEQFLRQIFTSAELEYCMGHRDPYPALAARWAAKEAVSKAYGTGIGQGLHFIDIEVMRKPSGQPFIAFSARAQELLGNPACCISLSHEKDYAIAFVVATA